MEFIKEIKVDLHKAMKSEEKDKVVTLRSLLAKLKDKQISLGVDLSEKEVLSVIKTLVKQRKESFSIYKKAGRDDLALKEETEFKIYESYLPQSMSLDEIKNLVSCLIKETGVTDISEIGRIMPLIMKRGGSSMDGKIANQVLRELLA
jgi:uncharacterized protein YqeY